MKFDISVPFSFIGKIIEFAQNEKAEEIVPLSTFKNIHFFQR